MSALDHTRTGRLVIAGVWLCATIVMIASAANGALTFDALGSYWPVGLAIGIAVDIALCVALVGDRALHQAGCRSEWGMALRVVTAGMSLALNTGASIVFEHYAAAVFHAFLPVLLLVLTEASQSYNLQFHTIADEHDAAERARREAEQRAAEQAVAEQREAERREREERQAERDAIAAQQREEQERETRKLAAELAALQVMTAALATKRKRSTTTRATPKRNPARKPVAESGSAHPLDEPEVPGETAEERRRRLDRNRKRRQAAKQQETPRLAVAR